MLRGFVHRLTTLVRKTRRLHGRRDIHQSPHNTRISSVRTSEADTNAKVLHGHNRPTTSTTIRTVTHNLSTSLRRPRKLAEEQLILNVPANASGSELSASTKISRHPRSGDTHKGAPRGGLRFATPADMIIGSRRWSNAHRE